jgi:hypothetical protein
VLVSQAFRLFLRASLGMSCKQVLSFVPHAYDGCSSWLHLTVTSIDIHAARESRGSGPEHASHQENASIGCRREACLQA